MASETDAHVSAEDDGAPVVDESSLPTEETAEEDKRSPPEDTSKLGQATEVPDNWDDDNGAPNDAEVSSPKEETVDKSSLLEADISKSEESADALNDKTSLEMPETEEPTAVDGGSVAITQASLESTVAEKKADEDEGNGETSEIVEDSPSNDGRVEDPPANQEEGSTEKELKSEETEVEEPMAGDAEEQVPDPTQAEKSAVPEDTDTPPSIDATSSVEAGELADSSPANEEQLASANNELPADIDQSLEEHVTTEGSTKQQAEALDSLESKETVEQSTSLPDEEQASEKPSTQEQPFPEQVTEETGATKEESKQEPETAPSDDQVVLRKTEVEAIVQTSETTTTEPPILEETAAVLGVTSLESPGAASTETITEESHITDATLATSELPVIEEKDTAEEDAENLSAEPPILLAKDPGAQDSAAAAVSATAEPLIPETTKAIPPAVPDECAVIGLSPTTVPSPSIVQRRRRRHSTRDRDRRPSKSESVRPAPPKAASSLDRLALLKTALSRLSCAQKQ